MKSCKCVACSLACLQGDPFEMFNSFFGGGGGGGGFPGGGQWQFNMGGGGFNMGGGGGGGFPGGMGGQRAQRQAGGGLYEGDANIEKLTSDNFPKGPEDWVWLVSGGSLRGKWHLHGCGCGCW